MPLWYILSDWYRNGTISGTENIWHSKWRQPKYLTPKMSDIWNIWQPKRLAPKISDTPNVRFIQVLNTQIVGDQKCPALRISGSQNVWWHKNLTPKISDTQTTGISNVQLSEYSAPQIYGTQNAWNLNFRVQSLINFEHPKCPELQMSGTQIVRHPKYPIIQMSDT